VDELARRASQDEGFFQVQVHSRATALTSSAANERVAGTRHVDEGKQYRLSKITFKNNCGISNTEALQNIFSIKDGEVFKRFVIAEGLEKLRFVYREFGYVDATSFPDTLINDKAGTISLMVDIDQGMQFYVTDIHVLGPCSEIALGSR
jgi:outer membrane protein assembly factor BamA